MTQLDTCCLPPASCRRPRQRDSQPMALVSGSSSNNNNMVMMDEHKFKDKSRLSCAGNMALPGRRLVEQPLENVALLLYYGWSSLWSSSCWRFSHCWLPPVGLHIGPWHSLWAHHEDVVAFAAKPSGFSYANARPLCSSHLSLGGQVCFRLLLLRLLRRRRRRSVDKQELSTRREQHRAQPQRHFAI